MIKSYLIPFLIREKEQEASVIKKANDFISFKFGDLQFLDIMKFPGQILWTPFSMPIKIAKLKHSSPMSGLTFHTSLIFPNGHCMKHFSVNLETTIL